MMRKEAFYFRHQIKHMEFYARKLHWKKVKELLDSSQDAEIQIMIVITLISNS